MNEEMQKEIFSKNLNRILSEKKKSQKEVADAIGVSTQTFNTWCRGIALPRMGKLQTLADYLMINKSALLDPQPEDGEKKNYYFDAETAAMAQELFDNPEYRMLFDAARDSRPEDLQMAADMLTRLKKTNPDG